MLTCKKLDVWGFHFSSGLPCHVLSMLKHTWKGDIINTTDKHCDKIVLLGQNRMLTFHLNFLDKLLYNCILEDKSVSYETNLKSKQIKIMWINKNRMLINEQGKADYFASRKTYGSCGSKNKWIMNTTQFFTFIFKYCCDTYCCGF